MSFKEKSVAKVIDICDYAVLGVAIIAGLLGNAGIAIAGVAIYLTGAKIFKRR